MMKKTLFVLTLSLGLCGWAQAVQVENVAAEARSASSILVSWDAVDDAAWYDLYQDSQRLVSGILDTEYLVNDLQAATDYQYFVTACDASGVCGEASWQASATTPGADDNSGGDGDGGGGGDDALACDMTISPQPVVSYADNGDGTITLSWCAVEGTDGYNLFIDNAYSDTYDASTLSVTLEGVSDSVYQIAWFANGEYPAKSAPATAAAGGGDDEPAAGTVADAVEALELASRDLPDAVEVYFTRHAEKMTELAEQEDGSFIEVCGESNCSEVLNPRGELRASLLAARFAEAGITGRLTHAFSSHKTRTRQTIEQIVAEAGLAGDEDKIADGIQEFPVMNPDSTAFATELDPESTSPSEAPVIEALFNLPAGSVALVAGHSGTLYDIMAGLGLDDVCLSDTVDTCDQDRYPINEDAKVRDYGDIWKIVLENGVARFVYRTNLTFSLGYDNVAD